MQPKIQADLVSQVTAVATGRLQEVDAEVKELMSQRSEMDVRLARLAEEATHLRALLASYGAEPFLQSPTLTVVATGKSLADHVADLLKEVGRPMHYREIERELRSRGLFSGGGKDPANSLLASYFNDSRLHRPSRGTYAIRTTGSVKSVGAKRIRKAEGHGR
jgi:hypothetical protein